MRSNSFFFFTLFPLINQFRAPDEENQNEIRKSRALQNVQQMFADKNQIIQTAAPPKKK